jgi:uncharacterized C2H2 Zn-finger protein
MLIPGRRYVVLMRQIKVFRCDICHAPFLFENNLQDHVIAAHTPKDSPKKAAKRARRKKSTS